MSSVGYDTVNGWDYMEGILTAESLKLENQARFILEKVGYVCSEYMFGGGGVINGSI